MADPAIEQVLAQNALIAQALYDLTKLMDAVANHSDSTESALIQEAKTQVNALNPSKFTFK